MLDGLLGRGFSSKCKSLIAKLMNRTDILKRKKRVVIGYLKKDIADLLLNGFHTNAYGRVEGLIAEVNRGCSYELMEKFCDCILSQLSVMQKQRDCPEESKEAVATVMFAAARFADLPELSDLRQIFTERYGNSLESFVNQEFVDRIALKPPSVDQKLELMQIIALEYSISWDVKRFKEKISNPSTNPGDRQPKHGSSTKCKDNTVGKKQEVLTNGKEISRGSSRKDIKAAVDSHERQSYLSHGRVDLNPGPLYTTTKEVKAERKDTHERERLSSHVRERAEPNLRAKFTSQPELNKDNRNHRPVTSDNKNVSALNARESTENVKPTFINRMPPPYVKPNGSKYRNKLEAQSTGIEDHGSTSPMKQWSDKSQVESNPVHVERGVAGFPRRFVSQGNDKDPEQDDVLPDARPKPTSVRRKHMKPPLVEDDSPGTRESVTEKTNGTRLERRGQATSNVRNVDEEEEMMDKLLLHYSKKSSSTSLDARKKAEGLKAVLPGNDETPYARNRGESLRPEAIRVAARALSLPSHPATEVTRVPARATSFEGHVHPKLPDYDELAAHLLHLKEERNSSRS